MSIIRWDETEIAGKVKIHLNSHKQYGLKRVFAIGCVCVDMRCDAKSNHNASST